MAVQKHNTYYDNELYYYDENGVRKPLQVGNVYSAGSGIKIENDIISVSGKYVTSADPSLDGKRLVLKDNKWEELVLPMSSDWLPTIKEASANSYNAATAWTNEQGYLTAHQIIPSAKWENASDVIDSNSAKWNDCYTTLTANSAYWMNVSAIPNLATKDELNTASSTLNTNKLDKTEFEVFVNSELPKKQDKSAMSAYALSSWVEENYQKKGDYLSANALDLISETSGKWNEVSSKLDIADFNEWSANADIDQYTGQDPIVVKDHKIYLSANYLSADALEDISVASANWNSVYETVHTNSGDWDGITKIKTFKTIGGIDAKTSADSLEFSAGKNIEIGINEGKIFVSSHDTTYDENDFISASHLENIISVSATVNTNSAGWTSAARALEASAGKWNELYDEYQVSSKLWNDTTDVVKTFSGKWNEVSSKANSADLVELSGKVETLSGELKTASSYIEDQIDVLSGSIDDINDDLKFISGEVDKKLDIEKFEAWSANADVIPYSAGKGLALNGHEFYVSANYAMSADVYNKNEVDEKIANFGGYATAAADLSGYPNVAKPSTKIIYLVKMSNLPASSDNYKEWIYTSAGETTAWECIGETTLDLSPYLTKDEAEERYQPIGNYVTSSTNEISAVDEYYGLIRDGSDNVQWAKIPVSNTTYTAGKNIVISGEDNEISVSGLFNTTLSSQDESIGISAIPDANGNITYNLSVDKVELPGISGVSGISAYYDGNQYIVGFEDYNDFGFAKFSTSANVFTTSAVVNGYNEDLNVNPTKITLTNDKILLKKGFYHVDVQTNFNVTTADNNYYDVLIKSIPNAASITQMIDASYKHYETVDLSFDVRINEDNTPIEISVENYKENETFSITNLNIHEIVSMPSQIEGGAGNYQAGTGITITNDSINAKLGNGLEFDESNAIQVKLGSGLKFDDSQGVQAIAIDNNVEEVVKIVDKLQEELDTKITDNFPTSMITLANLQVATGTQYSPGNGGMLIGYLFTCPISHNIYANNEKYKTNIGIYTKQWAGDNKKVILGIYEYDPDYNVDGQIGRTVALCDTGIIDLQQGYAEYEIKNVGRDTSPIMLPGKFYYATIYLSYLAGDTFGITLFGAPGYNTQVNNLKPGITITNVNKIKASLYEGQQGYSPNLNFDQMGFSWQFNSYPPDETTQYISQGIVEAHGAGRPYFAIRNVKK